MSQPPTLNSQSPSNLRVALVHDYLAEYGGAERVLEALHHLFPNAPLYTAFVDKERLGKNWHRFADWQIHESWLTKIPFYKKLFSPLRIFAPSYFSRFDLSDYDLVISSTNAYFAKAVKVGDVKKHFCYCHTPARSLWGYTTMSDWKKNPVVRFFGSLINHYLRVVDVKVARESVGTFIANSKETQRRIKKFYRLKSKVVYPPMNLSLPKKLVPASERSYYLYVNRLALAKHPEIAVQAALDLGLNLKVVGTGKMLTELQSLVSQRQPDQQTKARVEFFGFVSDGQLRQLYARAKALLYPVEDEDFGIVPIEAMTFGTPVIAHASGGPLETIKDGVNGLLFQQLTSTGLTQAIEQFRTINWSAKKIQSTIKTLVNPTRFRNEITTLVSSPKRPHH